MFISSDYSGKLISETKEGKVYWVCEEELLNKKLANNFDKLLEVFNREDFNEMVYEDNESLDEALRWTLKVY